MKMLYEVDEPTQTPSVDESCLSTILLREYGITKGTIVKLTGYEDNNFRVSDIKYENGVEEGPSEMIIKITNPIEARQPEALDVQYRACSALNAVGIGAPAPVLTKSGKEWTMQNVANGVYLPVRAYKIMPGVDLESVPLTVDLLRDIGSMLARLHGTLANLENPPAHIPFISPENHACVRREVYILIEKNLLDDERKTLLLKTFADLDEQIFAKRAEFEQGLIHSDFNETNIRLSEEGKLRGILDFGDMHVSMYIFDLAAAALYIRMMEREGFGVDKIIRELVAGYRKERPFSAPHGAYITAMRARLACSLAYGLRTARLNVRGGSVDYILKTQSNGWKMLQELSDMEEPNY